MAKLITNHDPFHIHKILGVSCLIHFLTRYYFIFTTGRAFLDNEPLWVSCTSVILHGVLSFSSLLIPIPQKRNFTAPMIWVEFRFHSILFASRHVVSTLLSLLDLWPEDIFSNILTKIFIIVGTIRIAHYITNRYGSKEKRTTNSMPYPEKITEEDQKNIKLNYTLAQFGATVHILSEDPSLCFYPLLAIQMAPLLMTLVRKGKIESITYHRIYSFTLWIPYISIFNMILMNKIDILTFIINGLFATEVLHPLRVKYKVAAENVWIFGITVSAIMSNLNVEYIDLSNYRIYIALFYLLFSPLSVFHRYMSLV